MEELRHYTSAWLFQMHSFFFFTAYKLHTTNGFSKNTASKFGSERLELLLPHTVLTPTTAMPFSGDQCKWGFKVVRNYNSTKQYENAHQTAKTITHFFSLDSTSFWCENFTVLSVRTMVKDTARVRWRTRPAFWTQVTAEVLSTV
jgi:hypothetical protein